MEKLEVTITHLEMRSRPARRPASARSENLAIIRAKNPTVAFYRFLYNTVGEPWLWYERRCMSDSEIESLIRNPQVQVYVLYVDGVPAGYVELYLRPDDVHEVAYFGLMPEFIGRGFGGYFLRWAVQQAWDSEPARLYVNTCTLDHPKAVIAYQQAGFTPYRQEKKSIDDPRQFDSWHRGKPN